MLHDGEEFLRRFSTSQYFTSVKMTMDNVIREKREVEEGKAKVAKELADIRSEQRWNLCRVANAYSYAHQHAEVQRLIRACFAVGGVDKNHVPQLLQADLALGDWAALKKDLAELEKIDPNLYRSMKTAYEMSIPSDI